MVRQRPLMTTAASMLPALPLPLTSPSPTRSRTTSPPCSTSLSARLPTPLSLWAPQPLRLPQFQLPPLHSRLSSLPRPRPIVPPHRPHPPRTPYLLLPPRRQLAPLTPPRIHRARPLPLNRHSPLLLQLRPPPLP